MKCISIFLIEFWELTDAQNIHLLLDILLFLLLPVPTANLRCDVACSILHGPYIACIGWIRGARRYLATHAFSTVPISAPQPYKVSRADIILTFFRDETWGSEILLTGLLSHSSWMEKPGDKMWVPAYLSSGVPTTSESGRRYLYETTPGWWLVALLWMSLSVENQIKH